MIKKVVCIVLAFLVLITASGIVQLFFIGEPLDGNTVITHVEIDGDVVYLHIMTLDSAMAFCGESRSRVDSTLYITLRKVLVSPVHDSGYHVAAVNLDDITQIVLGGKTVWTKK